MKVAAIIDVDGDVTDSYENCFICLFERQSGVWSRHTQVALSISAGLNLAGMKARLRDAFSQMEPCEVCILGSVRGILAVLLQDMGLRVWRSEGPLAEQLEKVAQAESCSCKRSGQTEETPLELISVGEGVFKVDLALALSNTGHNSRQLLIPVLEKRKFRQLEVFCDHQPRWFSSELVRLGLKVASVSPASDGKGEKVLLEPAGALA